MRNVPTTLSLAILTLIALGACVLAFLRLRQGAAPRRWGRLQMLATSTCLLGTTGLFLYRWLVVYGRWQPLEAHVDGLVLIAALLSLAVLYLQSQARLGGLAAFVLPILALMLAWAVCASAWTFQLFDIGSVWSVMHQASIYLGTLFFGIAAAAGIMFLYVQARLRGKRDLAQPGRLASLEALENLLVRCSGMGFALLSLAMISGVVRLAASPMDSQPWGWLSSKIVLGLLAWMIYGLVMNVRHSTRFRGRRAAWLSIAGLVLVLAAFAAANAQARRRQPPPDAGQRILVLRSASPSLHLIDLCALRSRGAA